MMIYRSQWEYSMVPVGGDHRFDTEAMNKAGEEGWELASFLPAPQPNDERLFGWYIFKRAY